VCHTHLDSVITNMTQQQHRITAILPQQRCCQ
jgi:hypothetical protein